MPRSPGMVADMPIISKVDHESKEIHAVAVGPVTFADVEAHLLQEKNWGALSYREFIDGRGAGPIFTPAEVRQIVELLRKMSEGSPLGRTAVLVSSDYAFGVMRMLEMLIDDVLQLKPFRDEQEAREWLAEKSAGTSPK